MWTLLTEGLQAGAQPTLGDAEAICRKHEIYEQDEQDEQDECRYGSERR